jgi:hypothetical protein
MTTDSAPSRTPLRQRVPLRITLVALLVGLVTLALAATGLAATSLLKGYLRDQQEEDLRRTAAAYAQDRYVRAACENTPLQGATSPTYIACLPPGSDEVVVIAAPPEHQDKGPELGEDDVAPWRTTAGHPTATRATGGSATGG